LIRDIQGLGLSNKGLGCNATRLNALKELAEKLPER
jgi:hypothetical protein